MWTNLRKFSVKVHLNPLFVQALYAPSLKSLYRAFYRGVRGQRGTGVSTCSACSLAHPLGAPIHRPFLPYPSEATFLHLTQHAERKSSPKDCLVKLECFRAAVENAITGLVKRLCGMGAQRRCLKSTLSTRASRSSAIKLEFIRAALGNPRMRLVL